jgi:hypothetical protein
MSALLWVNSLFNQPALQFSETVLDRPLDSVIKDLSLKAGRSLG